MVANSKNIILIQSINSTLPTLCQSSLRDSIIQRGNYDGAEVPIFVESNDRQQIFPARYSSANNFMDVCWVSKEDYAANYLVNAGQVIALLR